ncbi:MAG: hypothetical protein ACTSR3_17665 [Candidatus Helarchaeota archaeon]
MWQDNRNGNTDIYAQKVNSAGVIGWMPNGIVICNAVNSQAEPQICSEGLEGTVII